MFEDFLEDNKFTMEVVDGAIQKKRMVCFVNDFEVQVVPFEGGVRHN